jgi:hypothetical protein
MPKPRLLSIRWTVSVGAVPLKLAAGLKRMLVLALISSALFAATAPTSTQVLVPVSKYCHWPVAPLEPFATTAIPPNEPGEEPVGLPTLN